MQWNSASTSRFTGGTARASENADNESAGWSTIGRVRGRPMKTGRGVEDSS